MKNDQEPRVDDSQYDPPVATAPTSVLVPHTPGPWEVVRQFHIADELWLTVNQHADANGMHEWVAEIKYLTTEPERQWANAHLIAAAPDLLAALKAARPHVAASAEASHLLQGFSRSETAEDRLLQTVDAAIAKAEGR